MQLKRYFISALFLTSLTVNAQISGIQNDKERHWVDSIMNELTIDEKIAQLFMVAAYSNKDQNHVDEIISLIEKNKIGGLIFFQGGPVRQANLTNKYQSLSDVPLLIAIDGEWGLGMRLDSTIKYPRQMMLGAIKNDSLIYQMGFDIGQQLKRLGVHVNFAPVVDVNNNSLNPVINVRSFGENRDNVNDKGVAYMKGLQDAGIMAVAKHFPGHGDTDKDSHQTLPVVNHSRQRLDSIELYPFKQLISNGVQGIMVAHLNVPALEKNNIPTTLSKSVITDLLKKELGFKGIVFTDALNMKGVAESNIPGDIECRALEAGNDVLLFSENVAKAISKIKKLVKQGKIPIGQIETSCRKVLSAKYKAGLNRYNSKSEYIQIKNLVKDLNKPNNDLNRRKLIESGLTLIKNENNQIPVIKLKGKRIASVSFGVEKVSTFQKSLDKYAKVDHFYTKGILTDSLKKTLAKYDIVIAGIHSTSMYPSGNNYGVKSEFITNCNELSEKTNVIVAVFANPYSLKNLTAKTKIKSILIAFENDEITQGITAQAIFGGVLVSGKLPITINNDFSAGSGIMLKKKIRLAYGTPEEAGIDSEKLVKADSLVFNAINDKATPGCRVLVARNGVVFYDKSFGFYNYSQKWPINDSSIYDIASVTKIVATMPALMHLYELNKFNVYDSLKHYLPELDTTNKGNLLISDILTHQARLNGWIPFYLSTLKTLFPEQNLINKKFSEDYPYKVNENLYLARNYVFRDSIYSYINSPEYSVSVTENLYIRTSYRDTIFKMITQSKLLDKKEYRYSDLGYYYFYKLIEKSTGANFADYIDSTFYQSLGAYKTGFLPLKRFTKSEIVPTENDQVFRRQLIQGTVHDPGAAMLGGVCGHAGVFSTAEDLAKIMQMFLNGGEYGDERYFLNETINLFTKYQNEAKENRRALGFDKPEPDTLKVGPSCKSASPLSFGHSGFTGTMVWVDPAEQLVYIFLSNRVFPDQDNNKLLKMNVRTDVQQVFYDSIIR